MEIEDIKRLSRLARIRISDSEAGALKTDIDSVLDYVSAVNEITTDANVTKKVGAVYNVMREDDVTNESRAHTDDLLSEAPAREGDLLQVKKILSND